MDKFVTSMLMNTTALYDTEGAGTGTTPPAGGAGTPPAGGGEVTPPGGEGGTLPTDDAAADFLKGVEDDATREWLTKSQLTSAEALAQKAREQEQHLGSMVRLPGDDATDEDRAKFFERLGRPPEATGYEFKPPENLPESIPYDNDAAEAFKSKAFELGLSTAQAASLHDWFAEQQVSTFQKAGENADEGLKKIALDTRGELEKAWGPLDGQTAKANAEFADKALAAAGDPALIADLQAAGLLGSNKEPLNARFAVMLATVGAALYKEDDVLSGTPTAIGNPYDRSSPHFNLTNAMALYKQNPDHAKTLMRAAGVDPSEFNLPG